MFILIMYSEELGPYFANLLLDIIDVDLVTNRSRLELYFFVNNNIHIRSIKVILCWFILLFICWLRKKMSMCIFIDLLYGTFSHCYLAVDESTPWWYGSWIAAVFVSTRKINVFQHGGDWERFRPQGSKTVITFNNLATMFLKCYWFQSTHCLSE